MAERFVDENNEIIVPDKEIVTESSYFNSPTFIEKGVTSYFIREDKTIGKLLVIEKKRTISQALLEPTVMSESQKIICEIPTDKSLIINKLLTDWLINNDERDDNCD